MLVELLTKTRLISYERKRMLSPGWALYQKKVRPRVKGLADSKLNFFVLLYIFPSATFDEGLRVLSKCSNENLLKIMFKILKFFKRILTNFNNISKFEIEEFLVFEMPKYYVVYIYIKY